MKASTSRFLAYGSFVALGGLLPVLLNAGFGGGATSTGFACPFQATAAPLQFVVIATAFGIKPAYMLLSAILIWVLRGRSAPDMVALRWGLIMFLAGEAACAFNYVVLGGRSDRWEYLHDYGMVAGFSFIAWAVLEGIDERVIRFSAKTGRCAALPLCRRCAKFDPDAPCGLSRIASIALPALFVLALLPLCVRIHPLAYETDITGTRVGYAVSVPTQLFFLRYCPLVAATLLLASWLVLRFRRDEPVRTAKLFLAAAVGPLGFSLFRLFLLGAFRENLIGYTAWEEFTELLAVLGIAYVLFVFRASLLSKEPTPAPAPAASAASPARS